MWREVSRLANQESVARIGDALFSTSRSEAAKQTRAQADAAGEPQYVTPADRHGRLLPTGPVGHLPLTGVSLSGGKAGLAADAALLYQTSKMPGPWIGQESKMPTPSGSSEEQPRWLAPRTKAVKRWDVFWGITMVVVGMGSASVSIPAVTAALVLVIGMLWAFTHYYMRRTNRKEVMLVVAVVAGALAVLGVVLKALAANRANESARANQPATSRQVDALLGEMRADRRHKNEANGVWNPLDYGDR